MVEQRFGKLIVVSEKFRRNRNIFWECRCDCGNLTIACTGKLRCGHVKSCGCSRRAPKSKFGKNHAAWNGFEEISGSIWNRIKRSAKQRNREFSITIEYAWSLYEKQNRKCALTGIPIQFAMSSRHLKDGLNNCSLDRIDNSKGYVEDNVQWVYVKVNYMKQTLSQQEFIDLCGKVWQNQERNHE